MMTSCNWGRILLSSILFAVVAWSSGWLIWGKLFYEETMAHMHLWRADGSQEIILYPILGFLLAGFAVSCLYCKFCLGNRSLRRDLWFGMKLSLVAIGIASLPFYGYSPVSQQMLLACVLDKLLVFIAGTLAVGWILNGELSGNCEVKS